MWRVDDFLARVKVMAHLPSANAQLTDVEILDLANQEMVEEILPLLRDVREGYRVRISDVSVTASQPRYRIPERTASTCLIDICHLGDGSTLETPVSEISITDLWRYQRGHTYRTGSFVYYFEGDEVVLQPTPTETSGTLRIRYFLRPSKMVLVASTGLISGITSTVVTCSTGIPSTWTTSNSFDLVEGTPGFDALSLTISPSAVDTGADTVTFAAGLIDSEAAIGDYISLAGETPVVPLPDSLHGTLTRFTAAACLESIGYSDKADRQYAVAARKRDQVLSLLEPRNSGATKKLINWTSPLRLVKRHTGW